MIKPPWYRWLEAEIGQREDKRPGRDNERIEQYWTLGRVALRVTDDETPWCAAAVNAALVQSGMDGTLSGLARSFKPSINFDNCDERLGAIVVLSSPRGPTLGHVGLLAGVSAKHLHLLGGNQGDAVCIAPFPRDRMLYRLWPRRGQDYTKYPLAPGIEAGASVQPTRDG